MISGATGSARTSSTRRGTCGCSRSSRPPTPTRRWSGDFPLRRSHARQGRGGGEGHAELHRQSHRPLRRGADARGAGHRQVHDRGDRRDHGTSALGTAGQRDVPDHGHRRHRRARARAAQPQRAPAEGIGSRCLRGAATGREADPTRCVRRERPARVSTSAARAPPARPRSGRSIRRRSSTARNSPRVFASIEAGKSIDDLVERVRMLFQRQRQGGRVPARHAGADAGLHRTGHAGDRQLD